MMTNNARVRRERNMQNIKTFNMVKRAIWSCVLLEKDWDDRANKMVDLVLLRDLMLELKV